MPENNDLTNDQWKNSMEKWQKAIKYTEEKKPFDMDNGWNDLTIAVTCGYCFAYPSSECQNEKGEKCPLTEKAICANVLSVGNESKFAHFVYLMQQIKRGHLYEKATPIYWKTSLETANEILSAIMADGRKRNFC